MCALREEVARCARTSNRVLVLGESGTGKELVASEIHRLSPRAERPFVPVNCAGLSDALLESELFGHVRGSFTGAYRDKPGKFELADRGTLFLDEVGEMTLRMQGLLLRVLETGEIQKVGADRYIGRVDVRVVAATNRDLGLLVERGAFRQDLYYRLNVLEVRVPALRDRRSDIRELADHFLEVRAGELGAPRRFSPDVYTALDAYAWPGNVRQLQSVVQRLLIHATGEMVTAADLPAELQRVLPPATVVPRRERRRTPADHLYAEMRERGSCFWEVVGTPYLERNLTRADVRELVRRGLMEARGHYTGVARLFHLPPGDYRKFLSFLRKHDCLFDYREFR